MCKYRFSFAVAMSVLLACGSAAAAVDSDCRSKEPEYCASKRLDHVKAVNELAAPLIEALGWDSGCFRVSYVDNPPGEHAILVSIAGARGDDSFRCWTRTDYGSPMSAVLLKKVGGDLKKEILNSPESEKLLNKTTRILLVNNRGSMIKVDLAPATPAKKVGIEPKESEPNGHGSPLPSPTTTASAGSESEPKLPGVPVVGEDARRWFAW